jgi:hypothetical protein
MREGTLKQVRVVEHVKLFVPDAWVWWFKPIARLYSWRLSKGLVCEEAVELFCSKICEKSCLFQSSRVDIDEQCSTLDGSWGLPRMSVLARFNEPGKRCAQHCACAHERILCQSLKHTTMKIHVVYGFHCYSLQVLFRFGVKERSAIFGGAEILVPG